MAKNDPEKPSEDLRIDEVEWVTVYEDNSRKIQACGEKRRAIDSSTGKIIIEY